jgi:hypothetical protein
VRTSILVTTLLFAGRAWAQLTPSPTSMVLASTNVGSQSATQHLTFTNSGGASVTVNTLALTGTDSGDFSLKNGPSTPATVAAAGSISVDVGFAPTATGLRSAQVTATLAGGGTVNVAVSGRSGPAISSDTSFVNYSSHPISTSTDSATITVSDIGSSSLDVTGVVLAGSNPGDFALKSLTGLPGTLTTSSTGTFVVTFTPTALGTRTATVQIASNDPSTPTLTLALIGIGAAPPDLSQPPDFSTLPDFAMPSDMPPGVINDLSTPADDLAVPVDFSRPSDLSSPPDLSTGKPASGCSISGAAPLQLWPLWFLPLALVARARKRRP